MSILESRIEHVQDHVFQIGEMIYAIDPNEFDIYEGKIIQIDGDKYTIFYPEYYSDEVIIGTERLLPQTEKNTTEFNKQNSTRLKKEDKLNQSNSSDNNSEEGNSRRNSDNENDVEHDNSNSENNNSDLEDSNTNENVDSDKDKYNYNDSDNDSDSDSDIMKKKKKMTKAKKIKKDKKKKLCVHIEFKGPVSFYFYKQ